MLQVNVAERLGCLKGGLNDLKRHAWFDTIDWDKLSRHELQVRMDSLVCLQWWVAWAGVIAYEVLRYKSLLSLVTRCWYVGLILAWWFSRCSRHWFPFTLVRQRCMFAPTSFSLTAFQGEFIWPIWMCWHTGALGAKTQVRRGLQQSGYIWC